MALTMVVSMHAADEVNINLSVSPAGAASYEGGGVHAVGSTVTIKARGRTGFEFVGWYEGETLVSDRSSFEYTVPNRNVNLVARFNYTPEVPDGPGEGGVALRRELLLKCRPENCATFNAVTRYVDEGQSTELVAWGRAGFVFRHWEDTKGRVISEKDRFDYTMPKGAPEQTTLTAVYEYAPEPPVNPRRNSLETVTGAAIIDDFTEGRLSDAISELINRTNASSETITMLTIIGRINSNDYGIARYYPHCNFVDLSRTTGCDDVPSYVYDGNTSLEMIALPASTKSIGNYAFRNASALREIKCFATLPPTVEYRAFDGMPAGVVIRVPQNSVALYQAAEGWKDYTILPFTEDVRSITFVCGSYPGSTLSLVQEKSGLTTRMIMTQNQNTYTFHDLPRNVSYIIRVNAGDALGSLFYETKPIRLEDKDLTVKYQDENMQVKNDPVSMSIDVNQAGHYAALYYIANWYGKPTDSDEYVYLGRGRTLNTVVKGTPMRVHFDLDAKGYQYLLPIDDYEFVAENKNFAVRGKVRQQIDIQGEVADIRRKGIDFAEVTATYTLENGTVGSVTARSNLLTNGMPSNRYHISIPEGPFELKASAPGYLSQTLQLTEGGTYDIVLKDATGATVNVLANITDAATGETQPLSAADAEPLFTLERVTATGEAKVIDNYSKERTAGGVTFVLEDDAVKAGDQLRVTGQLPGHPKATAVCTVTADAANAKALSATAEVNFLQQGGINLSYDEAGNDVVNAILFDDEGRLVANVRCNDNAASFADLADGRYTLVVMGASAIIGAAGNNATTTPAPSHLQQMAEMGYKDGENYISATVDVRAGTMQNVHLTVIPTQPSQVYGFVTPESSLSVSKSSVVAGNYVTLTGKFEFKPAFAGRVTDVRLIADLPAGARLVGNSVMVGNVLADYIYADDRVIVPLSDEQIGEKVRFVIIPTKSGDYTPAGMAAFTLAGQETMQYIGQAFFSVSDLSINVPEQVSRTNFIVTGMAAGNSRVDIYDGSTLIGSATALVNGHYAAECNLVAPYSGTSHTIWAQITTDNGLQMRSVESTLYYDKFAIELSKVRMFNTAHTALNLDLHEYETVFDFINPKANAGTYWYWPSYPEFTFLIDFIWQGNLISAAQAELINNLILEVYMSDGTYTSLYPMFDAAQGTFVVKEEFSPGALPVSVRVFYEDLAQRKFDKGQVDDTEGELERLFDEFATVIDEITSICPTDPTTDAEAAAMREALKQKMIELHLYDGELDDIDTSDVDDAFANMTLEEQNAYIRNYHSEFQARSQRRAAFNMPFRIDEEGWVVMSDTLRFRTVGTAGLTEEALLDDGFIKFETTQGGYVFMRDSLDTESVRDRQVWICSYVDFETGRYVEIRQTSPLGSALHAPALRADGEESGFAKTAAEYYDKVQKLIKYIGVVWDELNKKAQLPILEIEKMLSGHLTDQKNVANMIKRYKGDKWSWEYLTLLADKKAADISVVSSKAAKRIAGPLCTKILKLFAVADVLKTAYDIYSTIDEVVGTYKAIPEPCPNDQANADSLQDNCAWFITTTVGKGIFDMYSSIASAVEIIGGLLSSVATAGTSLSATGFGIATKVGQLALDLIVDWGLDKWKKSIKDGVNELKCKEDCKPGEQCPKPKCPPGKVCCPPGAKCGPNGGPPSGGPGGGGSATAVQDPSGFVYEAVLANRVEGATATIFERVNTEDMFGDIHSETVVWDATLYAQQNPQITDDAGRYGWDVPDGLWQVRIEKTGYETNQSAWLPVPPPQLEVNIPLRNLSQPQVAEVKAYDTGVVIDFTKYMKASTLSVSGLTGTIDGATVLVSRDGKYIDGTLELVAPEEDAETAEPLARRIRFVPTTKFPAGTVTLTVTPDVRCYANIPMAEVFQQTFTVEAEPKQFVCDDLVLLERGASRNVTVQVVPASAAKGRQVRVHMASRTLAAITGALDGELLLTPDAQGRVTFEVSSMLPGNTAIDVTLPGTDLRTVIDVNVMDIFPGDVAAPVATIPTNSEVAPGTAVQLYCMTPDVKIYYTLDGSCPCTNIAGRTLYDGTPITIEHTTTLKAMAVAEDDTESAIAAYFYYVYDATAVDSPTQDKRPATIYGVDGIRRANTQRPGLYISTARKQVVR